MKKLTFFTVLLLIMNFSISAQSDYLPGYAVNNTGDTIRGLIFMGSSRENSQKCVLKADKNAKSQTFLPTDIRSYHYNNSLFYFSRSIKIDGEMKKVFLEWAVKGKLDLYLYVDPKKSMRYFVDKGDSGFVELVNTTRQVTDSSGVRFIRENKEYAATLAMMLQDCPTIIPEIYSSKFEAKDLIKLSADYHNKVCPDQKCEIFERPNSRLNVFMGPQVEYYNCEFIQPAFTNYSATVAALSLIHFPKLNTVVVGAFMDISSFNFLSPRLTFRPEMSYVQGKFSDAVYGTIYDFKRLRVAELLKYSITMGKIRPGIAIGLAEYMKLSGKAYTKDISITENNTTQIIHVVFPDFQRGFALAGVAQAGVDYFATENLKIALNARYEYISQFVGYSGDKSYAKNISVQLSVGFRLKQK